MIFIKFFKIPWYFQVFQVYSHFSRFSRSSGNPVDRSMNDSLKGKCIEWLFSFCRSLCCYRPQRSWGKVMFLHVSVILFMGSGVGWGHALQQVWGVVSQHYLQVSRPTSRGKLRSLARGVSRPTPGGISRSTPRESLGPHPGVSRPTPRGMYLSMHWGRPAPTATTVGGTHPTGMHSC